MHHLNENQNILIEQSATLINIVMALFGNHYRKILDKPLYKVHPQNVSHLRCLSDAFEHT